MKANAYFSILYGFLLGWGRDKNITRGHNRTHLKELS